MLVIDASALSEFLIGSSTGDAVAARLLDDGGPVHLPHLCVIETASVLRSWVARGEVTAARAALALADLADFPGIRHPAEPHLPRIWELRANLSAYDAHYVALAEALDRPLLTGDGRLARASGHHARVEVVDGREW